MLHLIINESKQKWLQSDDCAIKSIVNYIHSVGKLRDTQIQAIETYLFLKIKGENKPLWQLFAEGFFTSKTDLSVLNINQNARDFLSNNPKAFALFDFAKKQNIGLLEAEIRNNPSTIDYESIIKSIFYNVTYSDYLMSLPMGAGKTFLMAAIVYIDLYFADLEPTNKTFAHNFLVLIPSGLKSSIAPSLRTINDFDPSWVIAEPTASQLKKKLFFEVLDEQKAGKKSNKARNPNAQKVQACLPNPFGRLFVVNAEKVILESFNFDDQLKMKYEDDSNETTNDLKRLIGKIPNLTILIDEVHHAATDDVKLRQAVNYWNNKGNITTVLGFSGTPYLPSPETIKVNEFSFKFNQITNTVYYYPLVTAIKKFLKTPTVKIGENLNRKQIIQEGIKDFDTIYKNKIYDNGAIAKIAIYCSNIEVLEEEVYPFLIGDLKINPDEILKFHGGNKSYSLPKENAAEFRILDSSISRKRYILLVQVGKEGWDCPSLTSVILSQKGDSPQNMILQTSCRCLRQVDKNKSETALIWLNKENADTLNKQLKQEQNTNIDELNNLQRTYDNQLVDRTARLDYLQLPVVDYYQMKITYLTVIEEETANTSNKLETVFKTIQNFKAKSLIYTSEISTLETGTISSFKQTNTTTIGFNQWLFDIANGSFKTICHQDLMPFKNQLKPIFDAITIQENNAIFENQLFDYHLINAQIRLAFNSKKTLANKAEVIPKKAQLLLAEKLTAIENNSKLYPNLSDTNKIRDFDTNNTPVDIDLSQLLTAYNIMKETLTAQGLGGLTPSYESYCADKDYSVAIKQKDQSFHYLPYNFGGSGSSDFELEALQKTLQLDAFNSKNLEIYYNGERGLTEFVINCFAKEGKYYNNIGNYTTDFLVIQRAKKDSIHKVLLIETKGDAFANDSTFQKKKKFMTTEFIDQNQEKFGYKKFDFLYLQGKMDNENTLKLIEKINTFFVN